MKRITLMSKLLLITFLTGFVMSCSEDEASVTPQNQAAPPTLPPASSFAAYEAVKLPAREDMENGRTVEFDNSGHAYLNYLGWHEGLKLHLALPAVAFRAAFDSEAQYLPEEDRWVWAYNSTIFGNEYSIKLYGKKVDTNGVWEMRVSKKGGYQNVVWIEGVSALDGSGGRWATYTEGDDPRKAFNIEWKAASKEGEIPSVKYTNLDTKSKLEGTYIEYGSLTDSDFTVYYHIFHAEEDRMLKIEFNSKTSQGRVSDAAHFGDQAWHCWNSDFENTVCK